MKRLLSSIPILAVLLFASAGPEIRAQDKEFLTPAEINSIQDAQDPAKRVTLYLAFARQRIDEVKEKAASKASDAGEWIQRRMEEYTSILDVLEESLQLAREQRSQLAKPVKQMVSDMTEFQAYLQSLNSSAAENLEDYKFTLEEALQTTGEELAEAKKGAFPEVKDRTPPTDLPSKPPRPGTAASSSPAPRSGAAADAPSSKSSVSPTPSSGSADGPPRKSQSPPSSSSATSTDSPASSSSKSGEDGPPRKSDRKKSQDQ